MVAFRIAFATCLVFLLPACTSSNTLNLHTHIINAESIAQTASLRRQDISTSYFTLAAWQKINAPASQTMRIYIEGDGRAWITRSRPSTDPTPTNPVALKLAAADPSGNVVYLARPCQFRPDDIKANQCNRQYWTQDRFAAKVIQSYDQALNTIKDKSAITEFELIGFSGGANIAGMLAARRNDIVNLRTVAGNIDNDNFVKHHKVSAMSSALNMADYKMQLQSVPQYHFIGGHDKTIPASLFQTYKAGFANPSCLNHSIVPNLTHNTGWDAAWPDLIKRPVTCKKAPTL